MTSSSSSSSSSDDMFPVSNKDDSKDTRIPPINYLCLISILEHIEANKRIALSLSCPSLRSIENSVPLHLNELSFFMSSVKVNEIWYRWKNLSREEAAEMFFNNRTSPIYVHNEMLVVPIGKLKIRSKFWPTKLIAFKEKDGDVIFGDNSELFCTKILKELEIEQLERVEDLLIHPIMHHLQHLTLCGKDSLIREYIDELSNLPVSNLSICAGDMNTHLTLLQFWIGQKIPNKKFTLTDVPDLEIFIFQLKMRRVNLKEGFFGNKKCWIVSNDDPDSDSDSEAVITVDSQYYRQGRILCSISVQVMHKGSAKI